MSVSSCCRLLLIIPRLIAPPLITPPLTLALAVLMTAGGIAHRTPAQGPSFGGFAASKWKVGDEVMFPFAGKYKRGTVVGITGPFVTVESELRGHKHRQSVNAPLVRSVDEVEEGSSTPPTVPSLFGGSWQPKNPYTTSRPSRTVRPPDAPLIQTRPESQSRLWMDAGGTHTIEAELVSKSDSSVQLKRRDGSQVSLSIDRLSVGDRRFLRTQDESTTDQSVPSSVPEPIRPFVSVPVERVSSTQQARSESAPASEDGRAWKSVSFPAPFRSDILPVGRGGRFVIVTGEDSGGSRSLLVNLQTNDVIARVLWPERVKIYDYDAAADHLLIGADVDGFSKSKFMIALSGLRSYELKGIGYLDADEFRSQQITVPGVPAAFQPRSFARPFENGAISGDRMLVKKEDVLSCLKIGTGKVLFAFPHGVHESSITLSPDKRFLAAGGHQVSIVEISSGRTVRTLDPTDGPTRVTAFSPDGRKLATKGFRMLDIWDLGSSKRLSFESVASLINDGSLGRIQWIDGKNILVNNQFLYNVESRNVVWSYSTLKDTQFTPRGMTKLVGLSGDARQLVGYKIPHAAARERIAAGNVGESVLLDATSPIQVLVDAHPDLYEQIQQIAESVAKNSGWNLQPEAEASLIARVRESSEPVEITVRYLPPRRPSPIPGGSVLTPPSFGPSGFTPPKLNRSKMDEIQSSLRDRLGPSKEAVKPPKKIAVTPWFCQLELRRDGETLWQWKRALKAGTTVSAQDDETDEQIALRVIRPPISSMKSVLIPQRIFDPDNAPQRGSSKIGHDGIVDD